MNSENKFDNSLTQSKTTQTAITPEIAKDMLLDGNKRFTTRSPLDRDLSMQVSETAGGQFPFAAVLSCIDSRIPTEIIFDQGIGDIFNARIAGNFVNSDILGSLEFACKLAGSKLIVVLGHTSCGAVKGACDKAELGNLTQMLEKIAPAVDSIKTEPGEERNSKNSSFVNRVAVENVKHTIENIRKNSPVLKTMEQNNEINIVGAMYSVETGEVSFL